MMELKSKSEPRTLAAVMRDPVDPRLEAFIARGLARNPDERFQSALDALNAWRQLRPAGAQSMMDRDPSGVYPPPSFDDEVNDEDSASEVKTRVLGQKQVFGAGGIEAAIKQRQAQGTAVVANGSGAGAVAANGVGGAGPGASASSSGSISTPGMSSAPPADSGGFHPAISTQPMPQSMVPVHEPTVVDDAIPAQAAQDAQRASGSTRPPAPSYSRESNLDAMPAPRRGPKLLTLVLGAIGLMVVGFVTVALVLRLIR
jgi:hypothetical protein